MGSDSISSSPAPTLPKDLAKKKRTNRLAKLKQSKLDVRREQWLSQVKEKGCKMESNGRRASPPLSIQIGNVQRKSIENWERRSRGEENDKPSTDNRNFHSVVNSRTETSLDHNNCTEKPGTSSISSTSSDLLSGTICDEETDDGCLDNWETFADTFNPDDNQNIPVPNSTSKSNAQVESTYSIVLNEIRADSPKVDIRNLVPISRVSCSAWSPDDAFRPRSLPNFFKQQEFSMNSEECQCGVNAPIARAWQNVIFQPSCPICYENLDVTDTRFLPCSCGFRLCLFCHKRILEEDGRCPGCRKPYGIMVMKTRI